MSTSILEKHSANNESKERTHGISVESLAGPISDLVVKPVALEQKII